MKQDRTTCSFCQQRPVKTYDGDIETPTCGDQDCLNRFAVAIVETNAGIPDGDGDHIPRFHLSLPADEPGLSEHIGGTS
jgi:hypothetical protein